MADPAGGFTEFAIMAWEHRDEIMAGRNANARVRRIYRYYYHNESMTKPDWCELLANIEHELRAIGHLRFHFQGLEDTPFSGQYLAQAAGYLNTVFDNDSSLLAVLQEITEKTYHHRIYDNATRTFSAPKTNKELIESDPAFLLDQFLWHYGPKQDAMAQYRVYVTPQSVYCPKVFATLVRGVNSQNALDGDFPSSVKLMIPGPRTSSRADKIVMYCQSKSEMDGGVEFLRNYQRRHSGLFENVSPRSTKPIEGLRGVAITPQPVPDSMIMHYAGQTRIQGMSFGMSRAAIIYLAMNDNYRRAKNPSVQSRGGDMHGLKFLSDCYKIAGFANIDIHLDRDDLIV